MVVAPLGARHLRGNLKVTRRKQQHDLTTVLCAAHQSTSDSHRSSTRGSGALGGTRIRHTGQRICTSYLWCVCDLHRCYADPARVLQRWDLDNLCEATRLHNKKQNDLPQTTSCELDTQEYPEKLHSDVSITDPYMHTYQ